MGIMGGGVMGLGMAGIVSQEGIKWDALLQAVGRIVEDLGQVKREASIFPF